jgi:dihydropyrimidinase
VVKGRITPQRFVAVTATNAAKLFGLFPRKGTVAAGADADLVIWDPDRTKPMRAADFHTNADYSPYEGWEITGWPAITIGRGEIVFADGKVLGMPGRGRVVRRGPTLAA